MSESQKRSKVETVELTSTVKHMNFHQGREAMCSEMVGTSCVASYMYTRHVWMLDIETKIVISYIYECFVFKQYGDIQSA